MLSFHQSWNVSPRTPKDPADQRRKNAVTNQGHSPIAEATMSATEQASPSKQTQASSFFAFSSVIIPPIIGEKDGKAPYDDQRLQKGHPPRHAKKSRDDYEGEVEEHQKPREEAQKEHDVSFFGFSHR
jgi:hypothetical protein